MSNLKKTASATIFIDYKPAEIRKNKDWLIVYYAKIPATENLKLFRVRVPKSKNLSERNKLAKRMELNINKKLASGWSPFYEETNNKYKTVDEVFNIFMTISKKEYEDGVKRKDTIRSYRSQVKIFSQFLNNRKPEIKFIIEIDIFTINEFLDYIYIERKVSPCTYNNYSVFLNTLFTFFKSKGYITQNPALNIKKKPVLKKKREVLTLVEKNKLKKYGLENKEYYCLCMVTYYSFIRRTELTKIKVSDISLNGGYITVLSDNSKNRKTENVTIPNELMHILSEHLKRAKTSDYLFSDNNFKPGKQQLAPKKISDNWTKFRKKHNVDSKYQFYSLKDTGITDLLNSGIPSIKVRDQARHHDLKITESYTQRNTTFDEVVKNANFSF